MAVANRVGVAIRDEFPIFEHTTYLNSCSQGALSQTGPRRLRGVPRRLGRERRRVGALGRASRVGAGRLRPAPERRAGRDGGDHVGHAGSERHRQRTRPADPAAHCHLGVRVPDRRPDRARPGAARGRGRARPAGRGRLDLAGAFRRGRSTSGRRSSAARPSRTGPAIATTSPRSRASLTSAAHSAWLTATRRLARSTSTSARSTSTS